MQQYSVSNPQTEKQNTIVNKKEYEHNLKRKEKKRKNKQQTNCYLTAARAINFSLWHNNFPMNNLEERPQGQKGTLGIEKSSTA